MSTPRQYTSFLVRLWREGSGTENPTVGWHSEVEHIQSGQRWTFGSLDETLDFLRRQAGDPEASGLPANE